MNNLNFEQLTPSERRKNLLTVATQHREQDMLLHGEYMNHEDYEGFRGCSVGCFAHEVNPQLNTADNIHAVVAGQYGYPEWLAHLQDGIFENLPEQQSLNWHVQLATALSKLPDDFNWQACLHRVHADILGIAERYAGDSAEVVRAVRELHKEQTLAEDERWLAARSAARSAAWSAAWSAAESAARLAAESAAWSAAESAAESAARLAAESAARSAAWSAARSAAESAARSAARSAAWSAARLAAESAAWSAARSAAWSAARSAAWSAARSAAWSAAESAAWSAAESAIWEEVRDLVLVNLEQ